MMKHTYTHVFYTVCFIVVCTVFFKGTNVYTQTTPSLSDQITAAATAENIPPALLAAIMQNESGFDPSKISSSGCSGLGQLCMESAQKPNITVQCEQNRTNGPQLCSPNCDTTKSYNWCDTCTGTQGSCQPDDRFIVAKNIQESARVVASKISSLRRSGCDLSTEAGVKLAAYSYNMGAGRITEAITKVGSCTDYTVLWEQARRDFTPIPCTSNSICGSGNTCGVHTSFTGTICLEDGDALGTVYSSRPITLGKLERKSDTDPNSYVSKIYADFVRFGGATPNSAFTSISLTAPGATYADVTGNIRIGFPRPQVKIPGLDFSGKEASELIVTEPDGGKTLVIPFLGEYIAAIYRYSIGIAILAAAIIFIVSGLQMMSPGNIVTTGTGDQKQTINQAKKRIISSLTALLLLAGSYTLLFTINPELVALQSFRIPYISGTSILNEQVVDGESPITNPTNMTVIPGSSPSIIPTGGIPYGFNNIPWYFQYDSSWNSIRYGDASSCSTIGEAGCGPSSIAMILNYYGKDVNPTHIASIAVQTGARICNDGTSLRTEFLDAVANTYDMVHVTVSRSDAIAVLQAGIPVFSGGAHRGYTSNGETKRYGGHFIVFTGIEDRVQQTTGQTVPYVRVNDPGNRPHKGITHMTQDMFLAERRRMTIFVPNNNIPPVVQALMQ